MSVLTPFRDHFTALLSTFCAACVFAARDAPWGDEASAQNIAASVAIAARGRTYSAEELFSAFEAAWDNDRSWRALPHSLQSAAYERALTLLTSKYLEWT